MNGLWPWLLAAGLGAYHGLNPAMGWLFAVAIGLQEKRRSAVAAAMVPIALGHLGATGVAVGLLALAGQILPPWSLKVGAGLALLTFGLYRLGRIRHPVRVGLRAGFRDLAFWSFLMASAHGAGLMLAPAALAVTAHSHHPVPDAAPAAGLTLIHGLMMFVAAGLTALVVYEWLGIGILRRAWVNTDLVWAAALVGAGLLTLSTI
ncbi:MAG: hypothetical protein C4315_09360 [Chloroflexota bacterium]